MIDTAYFLAVALIFLRLTAFLAVVKVFYPTGTPVILKACLGLLLSYGVVTGMDYSNVLEISNNFMLAYYMVNEVICGLILGFVTNLVFEAAKVAGSYMDIQMGFSMMNVMDPTSQTNVTMMANITYYIAMVVFFIINGHHLLLKCLVQSFDIIPLGSGINFNTTFPVFLDTFSNYFVIGVKIAIPLVLIIIIADLCMALVSRTVPQINVMILGMPVKMLIGLISFTVLLPIILKTMVYAIEQLPNVFNNLFEAFKYAPIVLIFADDGDKTEEATGKKLSDARKKGQIPRSKDVGIAFSMLVCTLLLSVGTGFIGKTLKDVMIYFLETGILQTVDENSLKSIISLSILKAGLCVMILAIPIMIGGVAAGLAQTRFLFTTEPLKPNFKKLNPISGFKNMFSKKSVADLFKNLAVVSVIGYLGYKYVVDNFQAIMQIGNLYLPQLGTEVMKLVVGIFKQITIALIIIAAIDYFVQIRFYNKDMKMSKQEVKDEYKQMEGDPQIKGKIKQKQREMAMSRMMSQVPDATVVITNPTHLAVAIKYEDGKMDAPKVVAKGADNMALKIKEVAKENNVTIMENKPLARMLYEQVEIDSDVPQEMYQAVAEILAMVYKMKNK